MIVGNEDRIGLGRIGKELPDCIACAVEAVAADGTGEDCYAAFGEAFVEAGLAVVAGRGVFLAGDEGNPLVAAGDEKMGDLPPPFDVVGGDAAGWQRWHVAVKQDDRRAGASAFACQAGRQGG